MALAAELPAQRLDAPIFPLVSVGTLPSATTYDKVSLWVSDSLTGSCSVGGGTLLVMCRAISGAWVAQGATSSAGGLNQLTSDVVAGPGSGSQAATVVGIDSVPLCSGFTPTNGQSLQYTTASSPNPCYTAVSVGASGITQLTGDVTAGPGSSSQAATVKGVNGVPLCSGFTPTTGQALEYTTSSFPNPCYTATSIVGGGNLSSSGSPAIHYVGVYQSSTTVGSVAPSSTAGQPFCSNGVSADPGYCAVNLAGGSSIVTGTLPAANLPAALSSSTSVNGTSVPASVTLTQTVASGTVALGTTAIASGACGSVITVSASGVATTDVIIATANTNPTAITGYSPATTGALFIWAWPTSGDVNFARCNNTANSITAGALSLNWRVTR